MADSSPLFDPSLISPEVSAALPQSYIIRPLRRPDYHSGFLDVLRVLTTINDVSEEQFGQRYDWMQRQNQAGGGSGQYFILVICDADRIVGAGTLVVERKL